MVPTLTIPVYNRGDLLERCLESIDHPVQTLFLIDNGNDPGVEQAVSRAVGRKLQNSRFVGRIRAEKHRNLGCGPSWNLAMKTSPGWWLFSGNDIQFKPGALAAIESQVEKHRDASIVCALGYSVFAMTELGLRKVGLFYENFYPAYFEDLDHFRRVALSGAKAVDAPGFACVHGEAPWWGSSTLKSDPAIAEKNETVFANLAAYYRKKWGGDTGKEAFRKPFNKEVALDYWELDPDLRSRNSLW
jgi:GT2 family glycosyltransferase